MIPSPGTLIQTRLRGTHSALRVLVLVTVGRRTCRCLDVGSLSGVSLSCEEAERAAILPPPRYGFAGRLDARRKRLRRIDAHFAADLAVRAVAAVRERYTRAAA